KAKSTGDTPGSKTVTQPTRLLSGCFEASRHREETRSSLESASTTDPLRPFSAKAGRRVIPSSMLGCSLVDRFMTIRYFVPDLPHSGGRVELPETESHHASSVMRVKPGGAVMLFDGQGYEAE